MEPNDTETERERLSGHAKRLQEYNKYRQAQEYQNVLDKISFRSAEYKKHSLFPGAGVWRVLGRQCKKPQGSATVVLPLQMFVPPTLVMWPGSRHVCFYTEKTTGRVHRVDGASVKFFKTLLHDPVQPKGAKPAFGVKDPSNRLTSSHPADCEGGRLMSSGWMPAEDDNEPWHCIPCKPSVAVCGVVLRGHPRDAWVTKFRVKRSGDGVGWADINQGQVFGGCCDTHSLVEVPFDTAVYTRWIRIYPVAHEGSAPGLRVALMTEKAQHILDTGPPSPCLVVKCPLPGENITATHTLLPSQVSSALTASVTEPQVVQKYVKARGSAMSIYRCVWKALGDSYAYHISNGYSVHDAVDLDMKYLVTQESTQKLKVFVLKPGACREMCRRSADIAALLSPLLRADGVIECMVTDWVRAQSDRYCFLQVKGWFLRKVFRVSLKPRGVTSQMGGKCAMCGMRSVLEDKMTAAMIYNTVKLKMSKGEWTLKSRFTPKGGGSVLSSTYAVCKKCYEGYKTEAKIYKEERQLASSLKMRTRDLVDMSLTTKVHRTPAGGVSYQAPEDADLVGYIKTAATGVEQTQTGGGVLAKWAFITYIDHIYGLPASAVRGKVSLVVEDFLRKQDTFDVLEEGPFALGEDIDSHKVHALSVRTFYATGQAPIKAFVEKLDTVGVKLCIGGDVVGQVRFPVGEVLAAERVSLLRVFPAAALKNCALRVQLGLVQVQTAMTHDTRDLVLDAPTGLYFHFSDIDRISCLPEDWKKTLLEGMVKGCSELVLKETAESLARPAAWGSDTAIVIPEDTPFEKNQVPCEAQYEIPKINCLKDEYAATVSLKKLKAEMRTANEILQHLEGSGVGARRRKKVKVGEPSREGSKLKDKRKKRRARTPTEPNTTLGNEMNTTYDTAVSGSMYNTCSTDLYEKLAKIQHPRAAASPQAVRHAWDPVSESGSPTHALDIPQHYHGWRVAIGITSVDGEMGDDQDATWSVRYAVFGTEKTCLGFRLLRDGPVMFEAEDVQHVRSQSYKAMGRYLQDLNGSGVLSVFFHNAYQGPTVYNTHVPLSDFYLPLLKGKHPKVIQGWYPLRRHTLRSDEGDPEPTNDPPSEPPTPRPVAQADPEPLLELTITMTPHTPSGDVTGTLCPGHGIEVYSP